MFAGLPGVSAPPPFGGSQRTVVVRLDPDRLRSYKMSPDEVTKALASGNAISPSGNVRIGDEMPIVPVNSLVKQVGRPEDHPHPARGQPDRLSPRRRHGPGLVGHHDRLRPRQRPQGRLHPGHEAGRRLDPLGREERQGRPPDACRRSSPTTSRSASSSTSRRPSPGRWRAWRPKGRLGAVLTGLMVLRLPPRLAERHRRRPEHPLRPLRGGRRPLARPTRRST